jgi:lysyl-tRNA synthetase class II
LNDADWIKKLKDLNVDLKAKPEANAGLGTLQLVLFEETTEAELWDPTYIIDYPAKSRRWRAPATATRKSPSASNCSSSAARSPTASPS